MDAGSQQEPMHAARLLLGLLLMQRYSGHATPGMWHVRAALGRATAFLPDACALLCEIQGQQQMALIDQNCINRVATGAAVGGALGASIGATPPRLLRKGEGKMYGAGLLLLDGPASRAASAPL